MTSTRTARRGITSKETMRRAMIERRAAVDGAARRAASDAASRILLEALGARPVRCVAGFWPLDGEIDPRPAVAALARRGAGQALPRMQAFGRPLAFLRYGDGDPLVEGRFKVMEPAAGAPAAEPDLVLVPLLAFDRKGGRLGYGAGFYDRTIAEHRSRRPLLAVGIGFACQEVADVPVEPHDQPLDAVVTEREFIAIAARAPLPV